MSTVAPALTQFALDIAEGLSDSTQKKLSPAYLYDDLGSVLFEAITLVPEYGLTRADERLLASIAPQVARRAGHPPLVAELGSGSGKKTRHVLRALMQNQQKPAYIPIDVSASALDLCALELNDLASVQPIVGGWMDGMQALDARRTAGTPLLLLFLGSSIGNIDRSELPGFFRSVRSSLRADDCFLVGADLLKPVDQMLVAYDDPTGVTAAFNKNVLNRINRELGGTFDLSRFAHQARWAEAHRRIEMHLVSTESQSVTIAALDTKFHFRAGETIWTESSHKFTVEELDDYAHGAGFIAEHRWIDQQWPFVEVLYKAR